ncbi:phosphotransferase [Patescibacteria group bacterium]|nr:phosphotransferase [Patescibacteria group bacterium]
MNNIKNSLLGNNPALFLEDVALKATGNGIKKYKRILDGEVNEVYDVKTKTGNVIVRFSQEEDGFTLENWAIGESKKKDVPVPKILFVGDVKNGEKKIAVVVESKIAGNSLTSLIAKKQLSDKQIENIVNQAGEILAKIHSIVPSKFGRLHGTGVGSCDTWGSYVLRPTTIEYLDKINKLAFQIKIPLKQIDSILKIIKANKKAYSKITPLLLHGDYVSDHVFVSDNQISGIIDFGFCISGDPLYDFSWWEYFNDEKLSVDWLIEGYKKQHILRKQSELLIKIYKLRIALGMVIYYGSENNEAGIALIKKNLKKDLEYFQS